ncbi:hypothetical protein [Stenotrophomonas sp. ATCM1_4]|nr:hypothetical protein [Stenotrophomonas sp. ATCM1_4]
MLSRQPSRYALTMHDYCPYVSVAAKATGLDIPAANAAVETLLAT